MKEGWEVKKLGEVCEVLNGFAFKSDKYVEDGVRVIRITNVQHGYIEDNDPKFYPIDECERLKQYMLKEQDLLMSLTGNVGRVGLLDNKFLPAALNQRVACLRIKDKSVELKYLFHHLNSELFETRCIQSAKGIAQKNMSTEWLKEYSIPIPPLPEQSRIVEELDLLSNIIEKKRQQLSELDNLAQSIFYDMFGDPMTNEKGWEVKPLKDNVYEMFLGPFGSALKVDSYVEKENAYCMVYEQKHAIQGTLDILTHYINKDKYDSLKRFAVKPGDFIMSCRGTIGKLYQLPIDAPLGIIHPSLMKIRIKDNIYHSLYFKYMLVKIVANESTNGNCVQMAITAKELGNRRLPLPPLSLQQLFAQKIEAIEKQKALIKQSIAETEELFNSRMDYYFS